jgi:hypothetical protein
MSAAPIVIRPAVLAFAELMEMKLRANEHKSPWTKQPPEFLLAELEKHASRLGNALHFRETLKIIDEAVDCGNFGMMLVDLVNR